MHHPTDRIAHTTAFVTPVVRVKDDEDEDDNPYIIGARCRVRVSAPRLV